MAAHVWAKRSQASRDRTIARRAERRAKRRVEGLPCDQTRRYRVVEAVDELDFWARETVAWMMGLRTYGRPPRLVIEELV